VTNTPANSSLKTPHAGLPRLRVDHEVSQIGRREHQASGACVDPPAGLVGVEDAEPRLALISRYQAKGSPDRYQHMDQAAGVTLSVMWWSKTATICERFASHNEPGRRTKGAIASVAPGRAS